MRIERLRERLHGYMRAQAWDAAEQALKRWGEDHPGAIEPSVHACRIHLLQGQYRTAYLALAGAVQQWSCASELLLEAMLCAQDLAAGALLAPLWQRCAATDQISADDLARIASVLMRCGLADQADAALRQAATKVANAPLVLINRAFLAFYRGDSPAAEQILESLINGPQDVAMAHWLLSRLQTQYPSSNHVPRLRERLSRAGLHDDDRAYLGFALFKELDDLGDYAAAWPALQQANALLAQRFPYDPDVIERRFDGLKRQFEVTGTADRSSPSSAEPTPIFIVGMHRSGTSLLEHLLSKVPALLACGETQRLRAAIAFANNGRTSAHDEVSLATDAQAFDFPRGAGHFFDLTAGMSADIRFVTEKWPLNFQFVGLIRRMFPGARVIHMRRDPLELCFANFRERLSDSACHTHSLDGLVHFHAAYLDLMQHWHTQMPGFILDVHYEHLVAEPDRQMQRVMAFCGLDALPSGHATLPRQRLVTTPSASQVRQPIHSDSVRRCQPYLQHLTTLLQSWR